MQVSYYSVSTGRIVEEVSAGFSVFMEESSKNKTMTMDLRLSRI